MEINLYTSNCLRITMKNKINMVSWAHEMIQSSERMAIPIMTHPGIEMGGATVNQALH